MQGSVRLAVPILLAFALSFGLSAEASGCMFVEDNVLVPQPKYRTLRAGPLTSIIADNPTLTEGIHFYLVEFPTIQDEAHTFTLLPQFDEWNFCEEFGLPESSVVAPHSADFDVTFYRNSGTMDVVTGVAMSCGSETGIVPFGTEFAVIWLSMGGPPDEGFVFSICPAP